jgi:Family of unknown function (DUF5399)
MAKTIDNLGDASVRYATDQALLDHDFNKDITRVGSSFEVSVTSPFVANIDEFNMLYNITGINCTPWAGFNPPINFESNRKMKLFSSELIPSLGSFEQQEANEEKILTIKEEENKKQDQGQQEEQEQKNKKKQEIKKIQELNKVLMLTKLLLEKGQNNAQIFAKRNEYQKG